MTASIKTRAKDWALAAVSRVTGRHAVLLPHEARDERLICALRTSYRMDARRLTVELIEPEPGRLTIALFGYVGHFPNKLLWESSTADYSGPCQLLLALDSGAVTLGGIALGNVPVAALKRRFCLRVSLCGQDGIKRTRLTGHYLPVNGRVLEADYFTGDNYVDHEAQSAGEHEKVMQLLRRYQARGAALEIGCATGGMIEALHKAGLAAYGLDISTWAIERANERLGEVRAWLCDVERDQFPDEILRQSPFGTLILWAVLEHFHDPFTVLAKLGKLARPGTQLLINTTNADSLTHYLFGPDWEGYFDWSHYSVERISVSSLRRELLKLGWHIEKLSTHLAWDCDTDPTKATVRDWYGNDARFRRLLSERDLGDLITCVAVKQ